MYLWKPKQVPITGWDIMTFREAVRNYVGLFLQNVPTGKQYLSFSGTKWALWDSFLVKNNKDRAWERRKRRLDF